jgi:hypothetical protein
MASMTSPSDTDAGAPFLELPLALRQSLEAGDCVLFIGAGIGRHLLRDGLPAPTGVELAGELAGEFKIESENPNPVYHRQSAGDSGIIFLKRRRFSG